MEKRSVLGEILLECGELLHFGERISVVRMLLCQGKGREFESRRSRGCLSFMKDIVQYTLETSFLQQRHLESSRTKRTQSLEYGYAKSPKNRLLEQVYGVAFSGQKRCSKRYPLKGTFWTLFTGEKKHEMNENVSFDGFCIFWFSTLLGTF